jgi:hypothetical protein
MQRALDLDPSYAETIVRFVEDEQEWDQLLALKSSSPIILFEQANLKKDSQTILRLKDSVNITLRRGKAVVRAYVQTGDKNQAMVFAKQTNQSKLIAYAKEKTGVK